jgi:hypothetical protein
MRETWERSIEEILFAGVVTRFQQEVATLRLRSARVEQADYEAVHQGMTRCSKFSGHDRTMEAPPDLPKFERIEADLETLRTFATERNTRKSALEKENAAAEKRPLKPKLLKRPG